MKKLVSFILALCLLFAVASAETMLVRISAVCYDTNSVGMDWLGRFMIGDYEIFDGDIVDMERGEYLFYSEIIDNDTTPDVGYAEEMYKVLKTDLKNGFIIEQALSVTESAGRYSGRTADWYIRYEFTPVYTDKVFILY